MQSAHKTFDEVIAAIKEGYEYHSQEAERFKALLKGVADSLQAPSTPKNGTGGVPAKPKQDNTGAQRGGVTFESEVLDILSDGTPRTGRQVSLEYTKRTGIAIPRKDFSSRLAIIKKTKKTINSIEYKDLPNDKRFWWGLAEWYDGDELKQEFKDKVYESAGTSIQQSILE